MSIRIDYKSFNFQTTKLTNEEFNRYKKGLQKGTENLEEIIPLPSFADSESGSIRALKIVVILAIVAFILTFASSSEDSPFYGAAIIISLLAFLGFVIYGGGILLSFISYSSFRAKRKIHLMKLRKEILAASSYDQFPN